MKTVIFAILSPSIVLTSFGQQHLPTILLKQAANELLESPLAQEALKQDKLSGLAKIDIPSAEDLLIRRLQGELSRRVEDNWLSINDPQRWQILNKDKKASPRILKSFSKLKEKMAELETDINIRTVEKMLNNLQLDRDDMQTWLNLWDDLRRSVGQIALLYNYFRGYVDKPDTTSEQTLEDFAMSITQSSVEVRLMQNMLNSFHIAVVPQDSQKKQLFPYFHSLMSKSGKHLCSMTQSPHQLLYNLYNIIALTEIKGYAMLQFSYMMLKIYNKGNFTAEADAARDNFEKQAVEKMKSMLMVLPTMPTEYLKCDPTEHKAGITYLEITRLLQGYIENEVDMNDRNSCQAECSAYTITESKSCYKDLFCAKQPKCQGRIFDCQFFHADAWVCMSEREKERRYDWVEYEDGTLLGNKGTCVNKIKVDSWWRWVFWHCSYCLCKCEEISDDSDRYWSLVPAEADTANNMVVSGVRFTKKGRVIYPQIEQAKALGEGGVDDTTRTWVDPTVEFSNSTKELSDKNNTNIFMMSYEQRSMDMDTLTAPDGHVLTGIKLRNIGGHLNLEIQVTPIEFTTGNLLADRSTWIANDNTPATNRPRKLVPIIMPDIPTKYHGYSNIQTDNDQYIQFDSTSAYKDVSQTSIPFIDSQPVAPQPASWLGGAGLYHKGRVGYGGFVGLKVLTYDFTRHIFTSNTKPHLRYEFVKAEEE